MAPTGSSHVNVALAALCTAGGAFGYWKARSVPSLIAGAAFGAAYGTAAYLINGDDPATGHLTGFAASNVLSWAMGVRFVKTGKVNPAGVMLAASIGGALYNWGKYKEWSNA